MKSARPWLLAGLLLGSSAARAFESDVHFGLTQWLAMQAGFDEPSAQTIAIGNQRVDSGDMQFLDLVLYYACLNHEDFGSVRAGSHHYASAGHDPGPAQGRAVVAGGDSARQPASEVVKVPADQAQYRLFKLGEALHLLQDSWAHQGVPDVPQPAPGVFACDETRAWGHPAARGGWNSHRADLTMDWPADTRSMARASYEVLTQYPALAGVKRAPRPWDQVAPQLDGFIRASTKTDKKRWFAAHGIADASFLEGISLPDGAQPFDLTWKGRKLPLLQSPVSRQHAIDPDLLDFYNRFFTAWVTTRDFPALASAFGTDRGPDREDLVARLKIWRLRDHGRVAPIAHSRTLTADQRAAVDAIGSARNAWAHYDSAEAAFFPLLPRGKDVSPLLPFYIGTDVEPDGKSPRAVAIVRFRHVPYDSLAVVAEKSGGRWRVTRIGATVDH